MFGPTWAKLSSLEKSNLDKMFEKFGSIFSFCFFLGVNVIWPRVFTHWETIDGQIQSHIAVGVNSILQAKKLSAIEFQVVIET